MTDDELREKVLADRKDGKVCMWVLPGQMQIAPLEEFVRQPADGILYDLNRLEECALSDGGIRWVNDFAVALTIRKLVEQRDAAEAKVDRLMLENCPDEMTEAQKANWARHQRAVPDSSTDIGELSE